MPANRSIEEGNWTDLSMKANPKSSDWRQETGAQERERDKLLNLCQFFFFFLFLALQFFVGGFKWGFGGNYLIKRKKKKKNYSPIHSWIMMDEPGPLDLRCVHMWIQRSHLFLKPNLGRWLGLLIQHIFF